MNSTNQPNLEWTARYEEACTAFRHYSIHVREIRKLSIAQGITLLAGSGFLYNESFLFEALGAEVFGILTTLTMWSFHHMYFNHSMNMQIYIADTLESGQGPWSNHRNLRKKFLEGKLKHTLFKHGVFILLLLSFIILTTLTIIKIWQQEPLPQKP